MDTHFEASPDLDRHDAPLSARLPDEPDLDTADAGGAVPREKLAPVESVRARKPGRGALLAGAAIVGVCVIAGGVFVLSPYNHLVPVPAKVAAVVHNVAQEAGIKLERPLAPSASLASVALPDRPNTVVVPKYVPKGRNENLNELLAMGPSGAPAPTAAAPSSSRTAAGVPAAAPDGPRIIPHEPGTLCGGGACVRSGRCCRTRGARKSKPVHPGAADQRHHRRDYPRSSGASGAGSRAGALPASSTACSTGGGSTGRAGEGRSGASGCGTRPAGGCSAGACAGHGCRIAGAAPSCRSDVERRAGQGPRTGYPDGDHGP